MKFANIIGKGKSLDFLQQSDLHSDGVNIGICEATFQVKCKIGFQGDDREGEKICRENVKSIWKAPECSLYPEASIITFDQKTLGLYPPSVVIITAFLIDFGFEYFNYYCFDAITHGDCTYPESINYSIGKYGAPERYLTQKAKLLKVLGNANYTFYTPTERQPK